MQLRLLSECNNELRIMKTMSDLDHHLALKFHVKQQIEDPLDKIKRENLECSQYKLDKLFSDRYFLSDVLHNAFVDMYSYSCFDRLKATNQEIMDTNEYRINLIEEEDRNRTNYRELSRQLRQQRNYFKTVLYDTNLSVERLNYKVEDKELNSEITSRYIENWEQARTEQHEQVIVDKESGPIAAIHYYQTRAEQEQRIHSEVELLVNITINETLTKIDKWMIKFDVDMEAQDLKIAVLKNKYTDVLLKRKKMEETYANHEILMKNWLKFKADRQDALDYWNKMHDSAIIVQAWWRGLLVRLQMGPYRSKKKGKAAQGDDEKKKKKKK